MTAQGKELIKEVWEVIARKYVDVRSGGFDQQRWAQLRDDALAKPLRDKDSVERSASLLQPPEPTAIVPSTQSLTPNLTTKMMKIDALNSIQLINHMKSTMTMQNSPEMFMRCPEWLAAR